MKIHELVVEMKLLELERRLTLYEEKYGLLSKDFYKALFAGVGKDATKEALVDVRVE